jgi:hypothetical protein
MEAMVLHEEEAAVLRVRCAVADLNPDVVVTQDLCAVCAVDVSVVDDALAFLGPSAKARGAPPSTTH